MGLAILAVGAAAIVSLQRFAVMGTMTSRHVANATNVTSSVIETMEREAGMWTDISSISPSTMPWLGNALDAPNVWDAPDIRAFRTDGLPVDASLLSDTDEVAYCTHVRAVFLGNATAGVGEADAARVEVRTFYSKSGRTVAPECRDWSGATVQSLFDNTDQTVLGINRNRSEYGAIYISTIIRRTGA